MSVDDHAGALRVLIDVVTRRLPYVAKNATYAVTTSDGIVDCTSGTFTVTLPTAVGAAGFTVHIKNSGTGQITLATTSAQTIDGNASGTIILEQFDCFTVASNGSTWVVL